MNELSGAGQPAPAHSLSRDVENCTFRQSVRPVGNDEVAQCRLLQQMTGARDEVFSTVPRAACEACVQTFVPTALDMNPVVASLLLQAAERIVAVGGTNGCDAARARSLIVRAEACLPVVNPDDDDSPPQSVQTADSTRPIEELLPPPEQRSGQEVREWAVGVTTAPRRLPTLAACLGSLRQAGWPEPRLFADSRIALPDQFSDLPVTWREPLIGAWPNYYLALAELYLRQPHAGAFFLIQDDALLYGHSGLRAYLEQRVLWPGPEPGIVSLFCSRCYTQPVHGWQRFEGNWVWCALAFIFSNNAAKRFLADRSVVEHRCAAGTDGLTKIDILIGAWAHERRVPIYYPTPSLVQHIGQVSTLWPLARAVGARRADRFAGDNLQ
jgi:hypothetical protein